jgi:hypothetical protein
LVMLLECHQGDGASSQAANLELPWLPCLRTAIEWNGHI